MNNFMYGGDSEDDEYLGDWWFELFVLFLILTVVFVVLYSQHNDKKYLALFIATIILAVVSYLNIVPKTYSKEDTSTIISPISPISQ